LAFTFFYRDNHVLELFADLFVPTVSGFQKIKIWDAGCAMGPEPYTLAMILSDRMGKYSFRNVRIDATDIDESQHFGETIGSAVYPFEELKRIPEESLAKYFVQSDREGFLQLVPLIRERIVYRQHDLLSLQPPGSGFHAIVCKNVLLHFSPQQRIDVLRMFHESLVPSGFLCMEHTQKMPSELMDIFSQTTPEAQIFQRQSAN
jgi:chemotaxis protein methyltransferase CheR